MDQQEYEAELRKRMSERMAAREREAQLRTFLQRVLEPDAYERLANIRISHPDLYEKLAAVLLNLAQSGQLPAKVSQDMLKKLIGRISPHRETKISFARK